jgi:hypothetical protein
MRTHAAIDAATEVSRRAECPFDGGLEVVELDEMLGEAGLQTSKQGRSTP